MNKQETALYRFGIDFDLSDVLLRPNISLSERLDSGDEPFERVRGLVVGKCVETETSDDCE